MGKNCIKPALPVMSSGKPTILENRTVAQTRGYLLKQKEMEDTTMVKEFRPFAPLLNSAVVKHFRAARSFIFDEPVYDIDYFHAEAADPMDYFIGSGLNDLGISMDALLLFSVSVDDPRLMKQPW